MQSSVSLLHDDLVELRSFIPAVQSNFDDSVANLTVDAAIQRDKMVTTSLFKEMASSQPQLQIVRRLRALADVPDTIDSLIGEKRWSEATSVYLRANKLLVQLENLSPHSGVPGSRIPLDSSLFLEKQRKELKSSKAKLSRAMQTFLARAKLFHRVALDDNLRISKDVVQLLQEWKMQLEQARDVQTSVMLSMMEVSALRPIAGMAASLEHCSYAFASTLASLALLDDISPELLLKKFLQLRLHTLGHIIDFSRSPKEFASHPFETVDFALCEWVRSVQWTFYLINHIFLPSEKMTEAAKTRQSALDRSVPLPLLHLVMGALVARQFGMRIDTAKGCIGETALLNLRKPVHSEFVHNTVSNWLNACLNLLPGAVPYDSSELSSISPEKTVLGSIHSGQQIAHLESSIAYQLEHPLVKYVADETTHPEVFAYPTSSPTWSGATTPNRSGSATPRSGTSSSFWTSPSSHYSTPLSAFGGISASALLASSQITKWKQISNAVCGRTVDLWTTYFHNLFLHRAQYVIQSAFLRVTLEPQIRTILEKQGQRGLALTASMVEPSSQRIGGEDTFVDETSLGTYIWGNGEEMVTTKVGQQLDHAHALTPALRALLGVFDVQLERIMEDLRPLIIIEDEVVQGNSDPENATSNASFNPQDQDAPIVRRRFRPTTKNATLPILRAEIQKNCSNLISRICDSISQHINYCTNNADLNADFTSLFDKAMLLGRLAKALDTHSYQLRKILWQLEWTSSNPSQSSISISSAPILSTRLTGPKWMDRLSRKPLAAVENLSAAYSTLPVSAVQHSVTASASFQSVYHLAYSKWVNILIEELGNYLNDLLASYPTTLAVLHHGWTNVNIGTASSTEVLVPAQPSMVILTWLREIVAVVYRAGAHNVDRYVLEYLVYCASNKALDVFSNKISNLSMIGGGALARDSALQLWFDLRFTFDVLSKRNLNSTYFQKLAASTPSIDSKWDDVAEAMNFVRQIDSLISSLKSKIDPVEASFYAPHITKNVKTAIPSYNTSLGLLMARTEQKARSQITLTTIDAHAANALACVPNVPRFATLPVSTPTLSSLREMQANATTTSQNAANEAASAAQASDASSTKQNTQSMQDLGDKSRQALEAAGALWGKLSEGVKGSWFS